MKKLLTAAAITGFLAMSGVATAADPVIDTEYNWTGFYVGAHGGLVEGDVDYLFAIAGPDISFDLSGEAFGALIGANYQIGQIVLGVEADYSWVSGGDNDTGNLVGGFQSQYDLEEYGTVRARIGFAIDRILIFAAGGIATVDAHTVDPGDGESDINHTGLALGAGAEYAITDHIRLRGEYQFIDSDTDSFNIIAGGQDSSSIDIHAVRAAAIFNF